MAVGVQPLLLYAQQRILATSYMFLELVFGGGAPKVVVYISGNPYV